MRYRLDKICANLGWFTRNDAKGIIKRGQFIVNGTRIRDCSFKVFTGDKISRLTKDLIIDVEVKDDVYLVLNKPSGYISSDENEHGWPSYRELLMEYPYTNLLHVAGRLDQDTEGLLVLTSDGKLIHNIITPKKNILKTYLVQTEKIISDEDCVRLASGVELENGYTTLPGKCKKNSDNELELSISEGKYHQVKRMLEAIDNNVAYLQRIKIGGFDISMLGDEKWKEYTKEELEGLLFG